MTKTPKKEQHIAIIGAGVSGISIANIWQKCGYTVTVYEASDKIGGQWNSTYSGVRLQNTAPQYQFSEFPWPFKTDRHPKGENVLKYINAAATKFNLNIKLNHKITKMITNDIGWKLTFKNGEEKDFSYVIIATGQYPGGNKKRKPQFKNIDLYKGEITTSITSKEVFKNKEVAVIGFGKTALDFATWSATIAKNTKHIFRTPRWTLPDYLLGIDYTRPFFARFGSDMMPSWIHSSIMQRFLHKKLTFIVKYFWQLIATLFLFQHRKNAKLGTINKNALDIVIPPKSQFIPDLRSASAVAPDRYYEHIAHKTIEAHKGEVSSFYKNGIVLSNGKKIKADMVCICCGNEAPTYNFLPDEFAKYLKINGGPSLYRH